MVASSDPKGSLRACLKSRTRARHDLLDRTMRQAGWSTPASYARFLQIQFFARSAIESWLDRESLFPEMPRQAALIAADLAELGATLPPHTNDFSLEDHVEPIGIAWALAGSSLGNRVIQREIPSGMPVRFLSDRAMEAYWRRLRTELDAPATGHDAEAAAAAAGSVFDHFLACVAADELECAA